MLMVPLHAARIEDLGPCVFIGSNASRAAITR
jgi:hypothetical protein